MIVDTPNERLLLGDPIVMPFAAAKLDCRRNPLLHTLLELVPKNFQLLRFILT
jgi:hypothetical protein